ncbi:MAG TPA: trypsin-like peptidase domain-containing protein [Thermoleophilaceae bacterium]
MTRGRLAAATACAVALVALPAAGCGGGGGSAGQSGPTTVKNTDVKVVANGSKGGGLDAQTLYKQLSPGVVTVISLFSGGGGPLGGGGNGDAGLGSGFVLDGDGYVATNAHVVTTGDKAPLRRAGQVFVEFADGNRVGAKIVGTDPDSDVALLKMDPKGLTLTPLKFDDSANLVVGQPVAAIGSPFGEEQSLSVGVISALDRSIASLTEFQIGNAIQTDAAINHGNSGGPLLDANGRVIGINSQIKSSSGGGEGVGFAIPANTAKRSLTQLRQSGKVRYGFLGVSSQPLYPQLAEHLSLKVKRGALVSKVQAAPARRAGLKGATGAETFQGQDIDTGGDVIVSLDGEAIRSPGDLGDFVALRNPGDKVKLGIIRDGRARTLTVTLGSRPSGSQGG